MKKDKISFRNGGHIISFDRQNGTRLDIGDGPYDFPLSVDLKVTSQCLWGCPWCYEGSESSGRHADLWRTLEILLGIPGPTEVAIGGGNPLLYPELQRLVDALYGFGKIPNLTIRDKDLGKYRIPYNISGLGVSITPGVPIVYPKFLKPPKCLVAHVILGQEVDLDQVFKVYGKILFLGFKQMGRSQDSPLPDFKKHEDWIRKHISHGTLSFDNLALSQIDIKGMVSSEDWETHYLGPDFTTSMFIDAVSEEYAESSTAQSRKPWKDFSSALEFFKYDKDN